MAFTDHAAIWGWPDTFHGTGCAQQYARSEPAIAHALIDTAEGMAALEGDWNQLFERSGICAQVFQQFNWCHHWATHFLTAKRGRCKLAIVTGRAQGRLVMVWPMVMTRRAGLRELSWLGEPVSQYGDVLAEAGPQRGAQLRAGWRFILQTLKPDLARLNKTRLDSAIAPLLSELGARITQTMSAPYLELNSAPSWAAFEKRYPAKAVKNRRRQYRRLEERGAVRFTCCREGPEASALAREAIIMKRAWLEAKGLVSPAIAPKNTE